MLADLLEALCGALLLDARLDADAIWRIVSPTLCLDDTSLSSGLHPVSLLFEKCAARGVTVELEAAAADADGNRSVAVVLQGERVHRESGKSEGAARLAAALACLRAEWFDEALAKAESKKNE